MEGVESNMGSRATSWDSKLEKDTLLEFFLPIS